MYATWTRDPRDSDMLFSVIDPRPFVLGLVDRGPAMMGEIDEAVQ